jgi:hypothetical protein
MDLTTGQRTFCIGLSGLGTQGLTEAPTDVHFVDTQGVVMNCNYFKMTINSVSSCQEAAVIAQLSGTNGGNLGVGNAVLNELSALGAAGAASGVVGVGAICGQGGSQTVEWHGCNGEVCTGVNLVTTTDFTNGISVMLTYGNLFGLSHQKLNYKGLIYNKGN